MKVLALGSHFDDLELAMGGTLLKHRDAGDEIYLAVTHADDYLCGTVDVRRAEQDESANILKAKEVFLFDHGRGIARVVEVLDRIKPDILYYPLDSDHHQDHKMTAQIGEAVARNIKITVLRYIATSSHSYYPNYFNVIDIEKKKELVHVFKSQLERRPKFWEIVEAQNRFFGSLIPGNGHYAEGFMLFRMVRF